MEFLPTTSILHVKPNFINLMDCSSTLASAKIVLARFVPPFAKAPNFVVLIFFLTHCAFFFTRTWFFVGNPQHHIDTLRSFEDGGGDISLQNCMDMSFETLR